MPRQHEEVKYHMVSRKWQMHQHKQLLWVYLIVQPFGRIDLERLGLEALAMAVRTIANTLKHEISMDHLRNTVTYLSVTSCLATAQPRTGNTQFAHLCFQRKAACSSSLWVSEVPRAARSP